LTAKRPRHPCRRIPSIATPASSSDITISPPSHKVGIDVGVAAPPAAITMVAFSVAVPPALVAVIVTLLLPNAVGVPVMAPEVGSMLSPAGKPVALKANGAVPVAVGVKL
jgi:hypothetical protein